MDAARVPKLTLVAGVVNASCGCCAVRQALVTQPGMEATRRVCPASGAAYVDRGDGLYEREDSGAPPAAEEITLLSDRPKRTSAKTRIELERATFAGKK
jgi:hypothetical protein